MLLLRSYLTSLFSLSLLYENEPIFSVTIPSIRTSFYLLLNGVEEIEGEENEHARSLCHCSFRCGSGLRVSGREKDAVAGAKGIAHYLLRTPSHRLSPS